MSLLRRPVPSTLRGRLVAACLVAALVIIGIGALLLRAQLARGLRDGLDSSLADRATVIAADVRDGPAPSVPTPPVAADRLKEIESLSVLYAPSGQTYEAQPPLLPPLSVDLGAARRHTVYWNDVVAGNGLRLRASPVRMAGQTWVVVVGGGSDPLERSLDRVDRTVLVACPLLLLVTGLGAWWLCGAALKPVERMRENVAELSEHDSVGRVDEPRSARDLAALARTFNTLLDGLHRSLARQRDLVADAGHELRTPLAVLSVELELADRTTRTSEDLRESISHARAEVDRLSSLCEDLLFLADADADHARLQVQDCGIGDLLADVDRAHRGYASDAGVALDIAAPGEPHAMVDPGALRRLLDNLLANAVRHTPPGGTVTVRASRDGDELLIEVRDTGPGFPPEFLPHAFERFRRADAARAPFADESTGAGLGLAIVASIAAAHGGHVSAANAPAGGAVLTVRLPYRHDAGSTGSSVRRTSGRMESPV